VGSPYEVVLAMDLSSPFSRHRLCHFVLSVLDFGDGSHYRNLREFSLFILYVHEHNFESPWLWDAGLEIKKIVRSPFGDQLEKFSRQMQIFSRQFV